jgi:hypothetical protein
LHFVRINTNGDHMNTKPYLRKFFARAILLGLVLTPAFAQAADEMRTACSGGFTGGSSGVVLAADGHLWSWSQSSAGAAIERGALLGKDAVTAKRLFAQAASGHFKNLKFHEVGNMTCSIELTVKGAKHEVSWGARQPAPALALSLYDAVQALRDRLAANAPNP